MILEPTIFQQVHGPIHSDAILAIPAPRLTIAAYLKLDDDMPRRQPGVFIISIGIILIGVWLIVAALGAPLVPFQRIWPVILCFLGLALLLQTARGHRKPEGLLFLGVSIFFTGLLLIPFSLGVGNLTWRAFGRFWPTLLVIVGFGLLILYLVDGMRRHVILLPSFLFGGAGLFLLPLTLGLFKSPAMREVIRYWPLLVIAVGISVFTSLRADHTDAIQDAE
jgi:hypothetical protein